MVSKYMFYVIRARAPKVRGPIEIGPFLLIIIIQAL